MTERTQRRLMVVTRWLASLAIIIQSVRFFLHARSNFEHGIAIVEIAGAILFAVPQTLMIGAAVLLAVFAVAVVAHGRDGLPLVYPILLVVLIASMNAKRKEAENE